MDQLLSMYDDFVVINYLAPRSSSVDEGPVEVVRSPFHSQVASTIVRLQDASKPTEDSPLQPRFSFSPNKVPLGDSMSLQRASEVKGEKNVFKIVLSILKSFVGSAVLFLPRAFANGGLLLSIGGLFVICLVSLFGMHMLLACTKALPRDPGTKVTYGQLAELALGRTGRRLVNFSLLTSQMGFSCAYLIYVANTVRQVVETYTDCRVRVSSLALVWAQMVFCVPISWVRHIRYFAMSNLFADLLILFGLIYILSYCCWKLNGRGNILSKIEYLNWNSFPLFLGTSVYAFEGIGLVLPLYDSVHPKTRPKFQFYLFSTITSVLIFFMVFASVGYMTFGDDLEPAITSNLPSHGASGAGTVVVQLGYCIALLFTYPLMLFPVTSIVEPAFLPNSGEFSNQQKWQKNLLRASLVIITGGISAAAGDSLENFVALIGGFCSVPLAFVYPALMHAAIVRTSPVRDYSFAAMGVLLGLFATTMAVVTWTKPSTDVCADDD